MCLCNPSRYENDYPTDDYVIVFEGKNHEHRCVFP